MKVIRVVVAGNIGVGKSTVMAELARPGVWPPGHRVFVDVEPIEDMRPFLDRAYSPATPPGERSCNIFMVQLVVAMHFVERMRAVERHAREHPDETCVHLMERSILDAESVFLHENLASGDLHGLHADTYFRARRAICPDHLVLGDRGEADVRYVLLEAPPGVCLGRAAERGREEERALPLDYIKRLAAAYARLRDTELPAMAVPVTTIDCSARTPQDAARGLVKATLPAAKS